MLLAISRYARGSLTSFETLQVRALSLLYVGRTTTAQYTVIFCMLNCLNLRRTTSPILISSSLCRENARICQEIVRRSILVIVILFIRHTDGSTPSPSLVSVLIPKRSQRVGSVAGRGTLEPTVLDRSSSSKVPADTIVGNKE